MTVEWSCAIITDKACSRTDDASCAVGSAVSTPSSRNISARVALDLAERAGLVQGRGQAHGCAVVLGVGL